MVMGSKIFSSKLPISLFPLNPRQSHEVYKLMKCTFPWDMMNRTLKEQQFSSDFKLPEKTTIPPHPAGTLLSQDKFTLNPTARYYTRGKSLILRKEKTALQSLENCFLNLKFKSIEMIEYFIIIVLFTYHTPKLIANLICTLNAIVRML